MAQKHSLQKAGSGLMALGMLLILLPILAVCIVFAWIVLTSL